LKVKDKDKNKTKAKKGELLTCFSIMQNVIRLGGSKAITIPRTVPEYEKICIGKKYFFEIKIYERD